MSRKSPCQGLFGMVFGHKFKYWLADYVYDSDHCRRCGMPQGGWSVGTTEPRQEDSNE